MSNAEEVGGDGAITQLPSDGSEFRNPLRRSGSTSSMPNYRLPTPGGALPAGRLPPINREGAMDEPGMYSDCPRFYIIFSAFRMQMNIFIRDKRLGSPIDDDLKKHIGLTLGLTHWVSFGTLFQSGSYMNKKSYLVTSCVNFRWKWGRDYQPASSWRHQRGDPARDRDRRPGRGRQRLRQRHRVAPLSVKVSPFV